MGIIMKSGRQTVLAANVDIGFGDLVSGVAAAAVELPANSIVVGGGVAVNAAFNSATSDALVVSGVSSEALLASTSIAATGWKALTPVGTKATAKGNITVTWTGVGAPPTAGALRLTVLYVVDGRTDIGSQG